MSRAIDTRKGVRRNVSRVSERRPYESIGESLAGLSVAAIMSYACRQFIRRRDRSQCDACMLAAVDPAESRRFDTMFVYKVLNHSLACPGTPPSFMSHTEEALRFHFFTANEDEGRWFNMWGCMGSLFDFN